MLLALLQDRIDAPGMKQCADSAADFQAYGGPMGRNEMLRIGQVRADFDFQHVTGGNICFIRQFHHFHWITLFLQQLKYGRVPWLLIEAPVEILNRP